MSKLSLFTQSLLLPILILSGCGGGGSKTPTKPSEIPSSSSAVLSSTVASLTASSIHTSSAISSSYISSVNASSIASSAASSFSSASSASVDGSSIASSSIANNIVSEKVSGIIELKDINGSAIEVDDIKSVVITLSLLDANDQLVGSKVLSAFSSFAEDNSLAFSGELSAANAQVLVVHITKAGFTDYARRFEVNAELNLKAILSLVPAEEISASTTTTISGAAIDGFNFSVSDKDQPVEAGANGGVADLTVSIPRSALPPGTTSIDVKMQAFDPNNASDAEYFPGAYADSDGNKLLSVAFNYTDIITNEGVSLKKMAASAKAKQSLLQKLSWNKIEAEPVIINRKIPAESCTALKQMGDSSKDLSGFQVPVYTYNPDIGLWDLLGHGTVYSDAGELIAENFKEFDCSTTDYVLEIKVSNEIFLSNWWNLDYPLVFNQPVKMCADVQLVDEGSAPIGNHMIFVHDDDQERSFSAASFVTDADGRAHIEVFYLDTIVADTNIELILFSTSYTSTIKTSVTLSSSCANSTPTVIKTVLPAICKVEGTVKDKSGKLLADTLVFAGSPESIEAAVMPAFGVTDQQGKYSLDVNCGEKYNIVDYFSWITNFSPSNLQLNGHNFSVDGVVSDKEVTDDGKTSILQAIVADQSKPIGYVFVDDENANQIMLNFLYAGDAYPLTYSFDAVDISTAKVYRHFSGTLTKADVVSAADSQSFSMAVGVARFADTINWPAEYLMLTVNGEISDANGEKSNLWGYLYNRQ